MNPYNFSILLFAFGSFFVSLLVWLKRQDGVGKYYFFMSLFIAIWGVGFSIMLSQSSSYDEALFSIRIADGAAVFIPVTWYHFTLVFSEAFDKHRKSALCLYFLAVVIAVYIFTPWFIPKVEPSLGFIHYTRPGPVFHAFTFLFFSVVPLGFLQLAKKIRRTKGMERSHIKAFTIASCIGFMGGALTFLPVYGVEFPQYGIFLMPIYPFITAYFMIRHYLFGMEEMVQATRRDKLAAIGTLVTSINHEIRNPLYVIKGLAESYLENQKQGFYTNKDEALQRSNEVLLKAMEQAQRAMEIMKRFAVFAKQGSGEEAHQGPVNLAEAFENILPLIRHELELDKIELEKKIPDNLPPIHADRRHIEEIFFNLIVNACQAMKDGGKLEIRAEQSNGIVRIEIADQGRGIPPDQLSKIFQPFYTTKDSGTGLGLYITKQLVERNKGRISVKSQLNQGTSFLLEFPVGRRR